MATSSNTNNPTSNPPSLKVLALRSALSSCSIEDIKEVFKDYPKHLFENLLPIQDRLQAAQDLKEPKRLLNHQITASFTSPDIREAFESGRIALADYERIFNQHWNEFTPGFNEINRSWFKVFSPNQDTPHEICAKVHQRVTAGFERARDYVSWWLAISYNNHNRGCLGLFDERYIDDVEGDEHEQMELSEYRVQALLSICKDLKIKSTKDALLGLVGVLTGHSVQLDALVQDCFDRYTEVLIAEGVTV
ncbi:hypothetical protein HDV00_002642 [Rhizophlyctis rosea]|nr:hypothetical protein HDV00_002642 [Rhizophlyctis rosea]